jgi:hypothetical protein
MLEMPRDVGKRLGAIARQAFRGGEREAHRNQTDHQPQREQDQYGKEQASPPAQLRFDIGDGRLSGCGHRNPYAASACATGGKLSVGRVA